MNPFIYQMRGELDKAFCSHVIDKFEKDSDKYQGFVGSNINGRMVNLDIKQSLDLKITHNANWEEENKIFYNSFKSSLNKYCDHLSDNMKDIPILYGNAFYDTGYQVQKTSPGGFYTWHHDFASEAEGYRVITVIWYLNDVIEEGYTEFMDGTRVQPELGKVLLFPSTWNFVHRGFPPKSENKYICTGWLYCNL